jgi:hypothetical protein
MRSRGVSEAKEISCRGDSDSKRSHGDTQPYHASVEAAQAITGKGLSRYRVSQSKTRQFSDGDCTRVMLPSFPYRVQPLCFIHFVGACGRSTFAKLVERDRYGSAALIPIWKKCSSKVLPCRGGSLNLMGGLIALCFPSKSWIARCFRESATSWGSLREGEAGNTCRWRSAESCWIPTSFTRTGSSNFSGHYQARRLPEGRDGTGSTAD